MAIAKIFYARIKRNDGFTIIDVPLTWRQMVQDLIDADAKKNEEKEELQ